MLFCVTADEPIRPETRVGDRTRWRLHLICHLDRSVAEWRDLRFALLYLPIFNVTNLGKSVLEETSESSHFTDRPIAPNKRFMKSLLIFLFLAGSAAGALSQTPAPGLGSADLWQPEHVPFSFKYDGKGSAQLLTTWKSSQENVAGGSGHTYRYSYMDPATHLKVTAEVSLYPDDPGAVDWVLRFRNDGS